MRLITGNNVAGGLGDGQGIDQRATRMGALVADTLGGRYQELASRGKLFVAHAIVTAPVIYSTAAGTGGPLLYNGATTTNAVLLGVGFGVTTVTTVAAALGITGGPTTAPSSTTAIDSRSNCLLGGAASGATPYRIGTVSAAGTFFFPFAHLHTGALTTDTAGVQWFDLGGMFVVPPGYFASVAASATASTTVASISMLYTEVPV